MTLFLLGFALGIAVALAYATWMPATRKDGPFLVDPWWMENADRWEWLRQYELRERDEDVWVPLRGPHIIPDRDGGPGATIDG